MEAHEFFSHDDLPVLQLVIQRAWEALLDMKPETKGEVEAE